MTREEAIRILTLERDDWETSHCSPMYRREAFQMAIEALKNSSDLISRQDAIDVFTCNGSVFTYGANVCKAIVSRIMTIPAAQPELIEKTAYIRGFEQGRTQGMIDAQGGKK